MENLGIASVLLAGGMLAADPVWRWVAEREGCSVIPVSRWAVRVALGIMWASLGLAYGLALETVELCLLCLILMAVSLTDLASYVIPDGCIVAAVVVRLGYVVAAGNWGGADLWGLLAQTLLGGCCAFFPLLGLVLAMDRLLGIESLGGGDLKLLTVAGMYVGWRLLAPLVMLACLLGLVTSLVRARGRLGALEPFAFGPAIAYSLWVCLLAANPLQEWFVRWMF